MNTTDELPSPPLLTPASDAVFLDLDGTLIEFAGTPSGVDVPHVLIDLLGALSDATGGALALVSGRRIDTIDQLLKPLVMPLAGLHGLERRDAAGRIHHDVQVDRDKVLEIIGRMRDFIGTRPGLLVEDKGAAVALHYRAAPEEAAAVAEFAQAFESDMSADWRLQRGHDVVEVRPVGADKGTAIEAFLSEPPFAGRRAAFAGDDRTDEHGFEVVNAAGGLSVKVGPGATLAATRLDSPAAVMSWLRASLNQD